MGQIEELRAFVAIVQNQSIGKAAHQVGIAKSGMSRRLGLLEERLGTELVTRTTRQWELTEAGRAYYHRATDILAALDEADAAARPATELAGDIRISVPLHYGQRVLCGPLLDFAEAHSGIHLYAHFNDRQVDLIGEHFDLAVRIGQPDDSSMILRRLGETCRGFYASPDYLAGHPPLEHPRQLAEHEIVQRGASGRFSWTFDTPDSRQLSVRLRARLGTENGEVLLAAAERGRGVVRLPDFLAEASVREGRLVPVLEAFRPPPLDIFVLYPATRFLPARVRTLIDWLADRVARASGN